MRRIFGWSFTYLTIWLGDWHWRRIFGWIITGTSTWIFTWISKLWSCAAWHAAERASWVVVWLLSGQGWVLFFRLLCWYFQILHELINLFPTVGVAYLGIITHLVDPFFRREVKSYLFPLYWYQTLHTGYGWWFIYEVHSTIISPGSWVLDLSGNPRAQKTNKA